MNTRPILFDKEVNYFTFRRSVWLLSSSKDSFYVFEKKHQDALLKMFFEDSAND